MPKLPQGVRRKPSGRYEARWRVKVDGRWVASAATFDTAGEARDHLAAVRSGKVSGAPKRTTTLAEWSVAWLDGLAATAGDDDGLAPASVVSARCAMAHVLPVLGDRRLADLTATDIRRALAAMKASGLAVNTRRNYGSQFRSCLAGAVEAGIIHASPWVPATTKAAKRSSTRSVALPAATKRAEHLFTRAEVDAMGAAMPERMAALLPLGLGSGLRLGEMLGLTVDEVDGLPERRGHLAVVGAEVGPGLLRVRRQMTAHPDTGAPVLSERLKTANSRRDVAVPGFVMAALVDHLARFGPGPGGLIFHARSGAGLRHADCSRAWRKARSEVGIEAKGYHDLRHTFTTRLVQAGVPLPTVAAMAGDAVETILRVYAHDTPDAQDRARDVIGAAFGDGCGPFVVCDEATGS